VVTCCAATGTTLQDPSVAISDSESGPMYYSWTLLSSCHCVMLCGYGFRIDLDVPSLVLLPLFGAMALCCLDKTV